MEDKKLNYLIKKSFVFFLIFYILFLLINVPNFSLIAFAEEKEGKQGDVGTADVDEPTVTKVTGFVYAVGRYVRFEKVKQEACNEN